MTTHQSTASDREPFELHRLAVTFVEATATNDTDQIAAILDSVYESELLGFLLAVAEMTSAASEHDSRLGFTEFLAKYRGQIDRAAERRAGNEE